MFVNGIQVHLASPIAVTKLYRGFKGKLGYDMHDLYVLVQATSNAGTPCVLARACATITSNENVVQISISGISICICRTILLYLNEESQSSQYMESHALQWYPAKALAI